MRSVWLNRYKDDENVVIARKPEDFSVLGKSFFRHTHGVLMPYQPLSPAAREDILDYARARLGGDGPLRINTVALTVNDDSLEEMLGPHPQGIDTVLDAMRGAFRTAVGRSPVFEGFDINNYRPDEFHGHCATMTYTQNGLGTMVRNARGGHYTAPADHFFMMEDNLPHKAPDYMPTRDNPRITYLMG